MINKFEVDKDNKALSFYAYSHFLNYIKNTIKASRYWIQKNTIYHKKFNLGLDVSIWEGWIIQARTSIPYQKNIIAIYLRRKFIPPYFDTYVNFSIIVTEDYNIGGNYLMNPKAQEMIELIANTMSYKVSVNDKELKRFLEAKIDSLLIDEESLYFYTNNLKIRGPDIFALGFEFFMAVVKFLQLNCNDKEKLPTVKQYIESKIKKLNNESDVTVDMYLFIFKISTFKDLEDFNIKEIMNRFEDLLYKKEFQALLNIEPNLNENNEDKTGEGKDTPTLMDDLPSKSKIMQVYNKKKDNWRLKVIRFLTFFINGGLTDYLFTFEDYINLLMKCQNTKDDNYKHLNEFIYTSLNLRDLENINFSDPSKLKVDIRTVNEKSKIYFNEDALAICIRTCWIARYLSQSTIYCPTFMRVLLKNYCTNKILSIFLFI